MQIAKRKYAKNFENQFSEIAEISEPTIETIWF